MEHLSWPDTSSFRFIEQAGDVDDSIIIDGNHHICVFGIMDPRNMLITNSLNTMRTKTIFQKGWALQGFTGDNFLPGNTCFK